jgi:hypothetical protein
MATRKVLLIICLIIPVLCLTAGYGIAGQWPGVAAAILTCPAWLLARKYPATWLPFICLLVSISLAAAGILSGSTSWLMIISSGFSLATWDLLLLNHALGNKPSTEQIRQYERKHFQSLTPALAAGLLAGFLGHPFILQIPLGILIILIALVLFGLDRAWVYIKK